MPECVVPAWSRDAQGRAPDDIIFPRRRPPDKPPACRTRSPLSINSPRFPDFRELREPLRAICADLKLKGSVLLAHEGINGTLAGGADAIGELVNVLRGGDLFGGRLDNLELKFSTPRRCRFSA